MTESQREGLLRDEHGLLTGALEFSDRLAGDLMVPRDELVTVPADCTPADVEQQVANTGFSRYPVVLPGPQGELRGYLHLKDLLQADDAQYQQPVPEGRLRGLASVTVERRGRGRAGGDAAFRLAPGPGGGRRRHHGGGGVPGGRPGGTGRRGP